MLGREGKGRESKRKEGKGMGEERRGGERRAEGGTYKFGIRLQHGLGA